ncbi:MAG: (2Fe-2S)-binding protein [Thermoflexales bacterium]|nr:(2Fe-2S)-binding protein [Thermoflexales bacterium]MCX7938978.1 (2Fe-2S)-binding protein [Thermoflexales bacterium]MDW8291992.1 (2Fe-2S)-binding protein [Anaerolineae bacterium]
MQIAFTLNGKPTTVDAPPYITLLELLRDYLDLTGTKEGCSIGECGACAVIMDGELVNSCLVLAPQAHGSSVVTIEGLCNADGSLSDLQENFIAYGAVQCGICIPGMIVAAEALLAKHPNPSRELIRWALIGNLCRCTGYQQIVDAIEATAQARQRSASLQPKLTEHARTI